MKKSAKICVICVIRVLFKNSMSINLRSKWKSLLLACAIAIGVCSLLYTHYLVGKLQVEERKKIEIWVEAYQLLSEAENDDSNLDFYLRIIENNTTIPVIIADKNQNIKFWDNIDSVKMDNQKYAVHRLEQMKVKMEESPIILDWYDGNELYVYYDDSFILYQLKIYPYIQLGIIILFIGVAYFA